MDPNQRKVTSRKTVFSPPRPNSQSRRQVSLQQITQGPIYFSSKCCAKEIKISQDTLSVSCDIGYCTARISRGVSQGAWYWEYLIHEGRNTCDMHSRVRVGVQSRYGNYNGPISINKHGYCYGQGKREGELPQEILKNKKNGYRFWNENGKGHGATYGEDYHPGDYVGCLLVWSYSGGQKNASLEFFKNGISQQVAFPKILNINELCPSVSLYYGAVVTINPGRPVKIPQTGIKYKVLNQLITD
ncbi:set1/ash2 histone methyltransferase complex subunit ash2 [Anaeramoeba flamelloides]|uniref:Set1/ash2 histone methyltransferase complex subunit ash2 n=1 Tax=Anaeramoeba flamelloides TaxID=1746091 RepID=A0AAV7YHX3_9EUKA|nr:set1/ash2 histone methyltransferase complex subunit ash2 [Anaeramoeba flamelloides]KAJ6231333.1 set1/ash2 histone methyltransferase complex subunit ash2 [Anaeramoeba flamelloides]